MAVDGRNRARGEVYIRLVTRRTPADIPQAVLLSFAHESEALTEAWRRLRASALRTSPPLLDLVVRRADGSEIGLQELQLWARLDDTSNTH